MKRENKNKENQVTDVNNYLKAENSLSCFKIEKQILRKVCEFYILNLGYIS